jgi:hypothetical protein
METVATPGGRAMDLTSGSDHSNMYVTPSSLKRKLSDTTNIESFDTPGSLKRVRTDETPTLRTSRLLKGGTTVILNEWYNNNVHYPYPSDETVEQLSQAADITPLQVKKWMANKRVRCFNTLSINGKAHPIKFRLPAANKSQSLYNNVQQSQLDGSSTSSDNTENIQPKRTNYQKLDVKIRAILNEWYDQHSENPYPSEEEKADLAEKCDMSVLQVRSWFANKRSRANNTRRQVPNYFINQYPEYSPLVQMVIQRREDNRVRRRKKSVPASPWTYQAPY